MRDRLRMAFDAELAAAALATEHRVRVHHLSRAHILSQRHTWPHVRVHVLMLRAGVEERDARLAAGMRRAGVPIHRIGTDADLATALIGVVASTKCRRA